MAKSTTLNDSSGMPERFKLNKLKFERTTRKRDRKMVKKEKRLSMREKERKNNLN